MNETRRKNVLMCDLLLVSNLIWCHSKIFTSMSMTFLLVFNGSQWGTNMYTRQQKRQKCSDRVLSEVSWHLLDMNDCLMYLCGGSFETTCILFFSGCLWCILNVSITGESHEAINPYSIEECLWVCNCFTNNTDWQNRGRIYPEEGIM